MLLKRTVAASRDVAWHVYYYNRRAKPRLLATSNARQMYFIKVLLQQKSLTLVENRI